MDFGSLIQHNINEYEHKELTEKDLVVKFRPDGKFELIQDMKFYLGNYTKHFYDLKLNDLIRTDDNGEFILVPKGYITDFGSVPQIFQSIVSAVGTPCKTFVLHDLLCDLNNAGFLTRLQADKAFLYAMKKVKINSFRLYTLYSFVRLYGVCIKPLENLFIKCFK